MYMDALWLVTFEAVRILKVWKVWQKVTSFFSSFYDGIVF